MSTTKPVLFQTKFLESFRRLHKHMRLRKSVVNWYKVQIFTCWCELSRVKKSCYFAVFLQVFLKDVENPHIIYFNTTHTKYWQLLIKASEDKKVDFQF